MYRHIYETLTRLHAYLTDSMIKFGREIRLRRFWFEGRVFSLSAFIIEL